MANLPKLGATQQALLEPFPDSDLSERDGYTYVDPYHYRMRLQTLFPNGFLFHVADVKYGNEYITGQAHFVGRIDDVEFDISVPCAEKLIKAADDKTKTLKFEQSINMLSSAGLKAICREIGLGLHLYMKAATKVNTKGGTTASTAGTTKAAGTPDANWDGNATITFGKHSGTAWRDIDDGYLDYITKDPTKANALALKEIARRKGSTVSDAQANVAAATEDNLDDEIPF